MNRLVLHLKNLFWKLVVPCLAVFLVLGAAGVFSLSDPHTPIHYYSDGLHILALIKHIIENGSYYSFNARLGAPFGTSFHDFPLADALHTFVISILAFFLKGDAVQVQWYFYYLHFFTIALTASWSLSRLGLAYPLALSGSLLYSFSTYHFGRGPGHLYLSAYFMVPLIIWLSAQIFFLKPASLSELKTTKFSDSLLGIFIALATGLTGVYYAFFGLFSMMVSGIAGAIHRKSWRPISVALIVVGITMSALVINLSPAIYYRIIHGSNPAAALRVPQQSEIYGLKIIQMLLPTLDHPLPAFNQFAQMYRAQGFPQVNENWTSSLGLIGASGFLVLMAMVLFFCRIKRLPILQFLATLNLAYLLLATVGGFGTVFCYLIHPQIRCFNRISVFISFVSILGAYLLVQEGLRRISGKRTVKALTVTVALLLTVFGLWDQGFRRSALNGDAWKLNFLSDRNFITKIEGILPRGASVYQMPYHDFPEGGNINSMIDYEQFKGFFHSNNLKWSYGAIKGRKEATLLREVYQMPLDKQIAYIEALGFQGILVNRRGYADSAKELEKELTTKLGASPLVSDDGHLSFFVLKGRLDDSLGARPVPILLLGNGFYSWEKNTSGLKWAWSSGNAEMLVYNLDSKPLTCSLQFDVTALSSRSLHICINEHPNANIHVLPLQKKHVDSKVVLQKGFNRVLFGTDVPPRRPDNGDPRLLAFAVHDPQLECWDVGRK